MKTCIDLNADMGEGFGCWSIGQGIDASIMPLISSANIAAGFHAGDPTTMRQCLRRAAVHNVNVGVHPGFRDLVGFGRRHIEAAPDELVNDVLYQLGALRELAHGEGLVLHHLKLHGALFMHAAKDKPFAAALCEGLACVASDLPIYCLAGSALDLEAEQRCLPRVHEFYADRDYDDTGSIVFIRKIVPRDPMEVAEKVALACREGRVISVTGTSVPVSFDSICIHSDTPGALEILKAVRHRLNEEGVHVRAA
ncbi:5-oxoprolinase subunit PxpA [Cobetia sp. L2A1]|uniref:5-oxoprolinase subunit PxpA n=1 Tax=Cobetia sp. L2A1 TaxID=2686360 RepID=UPI00131BA1E4|nr:5-oxoprolinase subunit PxpA [Cobetia sp. L2A1]